MIENFIEDDMDLLEVVELESSFDQYSLRGSRVHAISEARRYLSYFKYFKPEILIENYSYSHELQKFYDGDINEIPFLKFDVRSNNYNAVTIYNNIRKINKNLEDCLLIMRGNIIYIRYKD